MQLDINHVAKSTSLISAAVLDGRKWQNLVDYLHDISGARVHIAGMDVQTNVDLGITCAGYDSEWLKTYEDYYGEKNAWMHNIAERETGAVFNVRDLLAHEDLEKTEFYQDWIRPQEDILGGAAAMLFQESTRMFVLGGNIRRRDIEKLEKSWLQLATFLTPHLINALEVNRLLAGKSLEAYALERNGESRNTAVLAVNANRQILLTNGSADRLLETGDITRRDRLGRLSFCGAAERPFQRALYSFSQAQVYLPQIFEIKGSAGQPGFLCRTCAVNTEEIDQSHLGVVLGREKSVLLITITPRPSAQSVAGQLAAQYGLSPQESRIALKIAAGMSVRDISDDHQTSLNTVRNQLKSTMSKLGVNKQVDLTRIVEHTNFYFLWK